MSAHLTRRGLLAGVAAAGVLPGVPPAGGPHGHPDAVLLALGDRVRILQDEWRRHRRPRGIAAISARTSSR